MDGGVGVRVVVTDSSGWKSVQVLAVSGEMRNL